MKKRYIFILTSCIMLLCCGCGCYIKKYRDISNPKDVENTESETLNSLEDKNITSTSLIEQSEIFTTTTILKTESIETSTENSMTAYVIKVEEPITTTQNTTDICVVTTIPEINSSIETTDPKIEQSIDGTNTTINIQQTTTSTVISDISEEIGFQNLPDVIQDEVNIQKEIYPGMSISMGIFSLDGSKGYVYNSNEELSSACTIKAAYAMYVLQVCEKNNIDIWSEYITYEYGMRNDGSGTIKDQPYGTQYTIAELLQVLLSISDNTAYNILVSQFSLQDFQVFLTNIGGQNLYGLQYGRASVMQRKNEWIEIYNYVNSGLLYSNVLKQYLTGTYYCYLINGMNGVHSYMHKSGWSDGYMYNSASDCAIIDDNYLLIVLTQDYSTGVAHIDTVNALGRVTEMYVDSLGGTLF